ncbi:hypothetical protein BH10CHL1_BH10CHL1_07440 [soil metagenome]
MPDQHPDILNELFKIRAQEYEQRAANYRLLNADGANKGRLRKKLAQIGGRILANFPFSVVWRSGQLSTQITEEIQRSS